MEQLLVLGILAIPLTVVPAGALLWRFPPRMNGTYGYRSKRSMSSPEMWAEAQKHSGKSMALMGALGGALGALVYSGLGSNEWSLLAGIGVQAAALILVLPLTERRLAMLEGRAWLR